MKRSVLDQAVKEGRIEWQRHALERMLARDISRKNVVEVILAGEIIEKYPNQKPYPGALILGWSNQKPFHVVMALDEANEICYIVTVYRPDRDHFESDYKTRRPRD
jgi:hypothetical protein